MKLAKGLEIPGPRRELCVSGWLLRVPTWSARPDLPHQRVKIEIANVDAITTETMPVCVNYDCIPSELHNLRLNVSTLEEILADKLVSLPEAYAAHETNIRLRDIWDIGWLHRRGTRLRTDWVALKRIGYGSSAGIEAVHRMMEKVSGFAVGNEFFVRMRQLLPGAVYQETVGQPGFAEQLGETCAELLGEVAADGND